MNADRLKSELHALYILESIFEYLDTKLRPIRLVAAFDVCCGIACAYALLRSGCVEEASLVFGDVRDADGRAAGVACFSDAFGDGRGISGQRGRLRDIEDRVDHHRLNVSL